MVSVDDFLSAARSAETSAATMTGARTKHSREESASSAEDMEKRTSGSGGGFGLGGGSLERRAESGSSEGSRTKPAKSATPRRIPDSGRRRIHPDENPPPLYYTGRDFRTFSAWAESKSELLKTKIVTGVIVDSHPVSRIAGFSLGFLDFNFRNTLASFEPQLRSPTGRQGLPFPAALIAGVLPTTRSSRCS